MDRPGRDASENLRMRVALISMRVELHSLIERSGERRWMDVWS